MPTETDKQRALEASRALPDSATIDDAIERLCFIAKIEEGFGVFSMSSTGFKTFPNQRPWSGSPPLDLAAGSADARWLPTSAPLDNGRVQSTDSS